MTADEKVERLAQLLHEAGREAVEKGLTVRGPDAGSFIEWEELPDPPREGRRVQARFLRANWEAAMELIV